MTNLWEETISILDLYKLNWADIIFVCGNEFQISKENFEEVAKETNYDNGYGAPEIATDLKLIGADFWLERWEYDGSEGWEYKKMPTANMPLKTVKRLSIYGTEYCGWRSLREVNEE